MRSMFRNTLVASMATLSLGAVASAPASAALPEFSTQSMFAGTLGQAKWNATGGAWVYQDVQAHISGEMPSKTTVGKVALNFTGGSPGACDSEPVAKNELTLAGLNGRLGYLNKANKEVGLMLGEKLTKIGTCTWIGIHMELVGTLVARLTPVNTRTKKFTLALNVVGGEQQFSKFEGETTAYPFSFWEAGTHNKKARVTVEVAEFHFETEKETEIIA